MLRRVVVPLSRPASHVLAPRLVRPAAPYQLRSFAQAYRLNEAPKQSPPRGTQSTQSQYSKAQEEFQSTGNASQNTAPSSDDVASNVRNTNPVTSQSGEGAKAHQEEIDGFTEADADSNTTPEGQSSQQPLPDLTQGIPSTLDAELEQARKRSADPKSLNITEDPNEPAPSRDGPGGPDDGLPKTSYVSSGDRKRQQQVRYAYYALFASFMGATLFFGRNWESQEEEKRHTDAPSGFSPSLFFRRARARFSQFLSFYNEPAFQKLLPDADPDPALQAPFTLVLSLEDLLMHSEWTREHGWRIAKRPGVDYFIRYLSQYYELVIWTSQPMMIADPVIRKLDPFRILRWPLFREATLYKNGDHVKDLSYLNRDISKVLIIDTVPGHVKNQPENAIILPKWTGDPNDRNLVDLIPFLEYLAVMGLDDVKAVLKSFEGKDIPTEFARREKIMRDKFDAKLASERGQKAPISLGSIAASMGLKSGGANEKPKMLWDQVRERGQKQYEAFEKEIRENGPKWMEEMAAEEKKAQEEAMKNMKGSFAGVFGPK